MTENTQIPNAPSASRNSLRKRLLGVASLVHSRAFPRARREIRAILASVNDDPELLVAAGLLAFVTRDYDVALSALARAEAIFDHAGITWQRFERTNRLGWDREAVQILEERVARQPNEPTWHASLLVLRAKRQSFAAALKHGYAVLSDARDIVGIRIEIAGIHAALGDARETILHLQRATENAKRGPIFLEAARLARMVGAFAAAKAYFEQASTYPDSVLRAHLGLGELALWSEQLDQAEQHAHQAEQIESSAAGQRILGVIEHLRGNRESARKLLESALRMDRNESEAHMWLAEIALQEKRHDDAHASLSSAIASARGIVLAAYFLRLRVILDHETAEPSPPARHLTEHLKEALAALVPEFEGSLAETDPETASSILDRALARMYGNRSIVPTYVREGVLKLVPGVRDPRTASRRVLERIQVDPPEKLLAEFDELIAEFPASSLPIAHKGELLLWLGRLEESRKTLESAIELVGGTRWAYIGLSAIDLLEGNPEAALEVSARGVAMMNNTEGPAVFVHRGEALRLLGRDAEPDLLRAIEQNPSRVSAHMNLALVRLRDGRLQSARELVAHAIDVIPGLFSDAAHELGLDQLTDDLNRVDPEVLRQVLEQALKMLAGNRSSSCISYVTRAGKIRFGRRMGTTVDPLHARDDADIALAARVIQVGLSVLPSRWRQAKAQVPLEQPVRESAQPIKREPTLTPDEIETFLRDGYVRLENGLPPDVIKRWVEDVTQRLAMEAHRFARIGSTLDPDNMPKHLSFDEPERWPANSITVEGNENMVVSEVLPRLWGAVCDLVGGEEKLATQRISNHVIIGVPEEELVANGRLPDMFHVDHPQSCTRLDLITNGIVVFALLSDVLPDGGATLILPDSVPLVAQLVGAHPEGADLVSLDPIGKIAEQCSREVYCAGKAGDVFLAHPFMVHCKTHNQRKTFRWLSNPMFELREPMDPMRTNPAELSPVEKVIARALGRNV
jgi:tetratricopeptide (TPR) repeat protein